MLKLDKVMKSGKSFLIARVMQEKNMELKYCNGNHTFVSIGDYSELK